MSKLNQREADSTPKKTSAVTSIAPATLPATSGCMGSAPNAAANVHVAMRKMGFHGMVFKSPSRTSRGRSRSGRRRMLARTHARHTRGSVTAKKARYGTDMPMNSHFTTSPTKMAIAWYSATRKGLSEP